MPDTPRILITAGPTQEPIDAVRYLGNRSSGRLGIALADEAASRGHRVTLLLGPTGRMPSHTDICIERFRTTHDLATLLDTHAPNHDLIIMAAAVADFRPAAAEPDTKMRRQDGLTLHLEPTEDLLARLGSTREPAQCLIGFALEPRNRLLESAREKLERKNIDAIVANPLETMDAESISATLIRRNGGTVQAPSDLSKADFAGWLLDQVAELPLDAPVEPIPTENPGDPGKSRAR
ncbi:MAG: phosphopantothenoylcysteine decarboxylase [Planctomycetota bacterium]